MSNILAHYDPPQDPFLPIIHVDDDILVVNKPSGLLSVPGKKKSHADSVATRATQLYPEARIIHRLDMETSGLMILARNIEALRNLSRQFEKRLTEKRYIARVMGLVTDKSGTIEEPLICDWPNRPKQMIDHEKGKPACTHFEVLEREENATRILLKPVTGRSHQLRVHMLHLGHPILGDPLYASGEALDAAERLQLHACEITFSHPNTGEDKTFKIPAPF